MVYNRRVMLPNDGLCYPSLDCQLLNPCRDRWKPRQADFKKVTGVDPVEVPLLAPYSPLRLSGFSCGRCFHLQPPFNRQPYQPPYTLRPHFLSVALSGNPARITRRSNQFGSRCLFGLCPIRQGEMASHLRSVPTMTVQEWCALTRGVPCFTIRVSTANLPNRGVEPRTS